MVMQKTVASPVSVSGRGLHTGRFVTVTFEPAPAGTGVLFVRDDLPGRPSVKADVRNVFDTSRGTSIRCGKAEVHTVEHLTAALAGLGIQNAVVRAKGPETPILDGSARIYVEMLRQAGVRELGEQAQTGIIDEEITFEIPERHIRLTARPADHFSLKVHVDYGTQVLSAQDAALDNMEDFYPEVYNCRTFVFLNELQFLIANNLVRGGDISNAIVFVDKVPERQVLRQIADFFRKDRVDVMPNHILNNVELHHDNEPARHKLLDLVGDLSLLGCRLRAEVVAERPGHAANIAFARKILENSHFSVTK